MKTLSGAANQRLATPPVLLRQTSPVKPATWKQDYQPLPGKGEPAIVSVTATIVVTAVALESLVISAQKAISVRLLILIAVDVTSVAPVVAMSIPVKVRPLRIVALSPLRIP